MSTPSKSMELLGWIAFEGARLRPFLPTYLHLIASALFPIYVGAHASLSAPSSAKLPSKKQKAAQDQDLSGEASELDASKVEGLTPRDALLFPLLAGVTLSSLYFIIKWLEDPSILNKVLGYYFMQAGLFFGAKFLKDALAIVRSVILPSQYSHRGLVWKANRVERRYDAVDVKSGAQDAHRSSPLPGQLHRLRLPRSLSDGIWATQRFLYAKCSLNFYVHKLVTLKMPVDVLDAIAICTSLTITGVFTFLYKPWYVSNLIGFAFCYGSTQFMSPTTFWTGTLLLSALFCYDIYFVFYTPMMVTVATKLDVPIKLLFPRPASALESEKGFQGMAMLGLGDIVIPGMMIALALRFDLYLHYTRISQKVDGEIEKPVYRPATGGWGERFWVTRSAAGPDLQAKLFPKPYFRAGTCGYILGMIVTLLMMQISDKPQPALLYLVPGVLGALWGTAALKGDLNEMWNYSEEKVAEKSPKSAKRTEPQTSADAVKEKMNEEKSEETTTDSNEESAAKTDRTSQTDDSTHPLIRTEKKAAEIPNDDFDSKSSLTSLSDSTSSTNSVSEFRGQNPKTSTLTKRGKFEQEDHLIWFSIDFPSLLPPRPTTQREPIGANENSQNHDSSSPSSSSNSVNVKGSNELSYEVMQKLRERQTAEVKSSPQKEEPPGKRRRVK